MVTLRRSAYLICGDWQVAEDAVAVALTKLYVHWAKASASTNLDAYVRRILMRSIVDEWRRPWAAAGEPGRVRRADRGASAAE